MGWSGGDRPSTITYTILTGIAVAVALALLSIPGLDVAWRIGSIVVLSLLGLLNLFAYLGLLTRFSLWTKERRVTSRINRTNGLAYELRNVVTLINATFYEEQTGTLLYLARTIDSHATNKPELTQIVFRASRECSIFLDLSYNTKRWEGNAFWAFIRRLCMHFDTADFVIEECRKVAATLGQNDVVTAMWEAYKERHNALRIRFDGYLDTIRKETGVNFQLKGNPMKSLTRQ